ncbi:MAG: trypsin-like peptidase domain-containing protein [Gemmatimonadota bacterium]
MKTLAPLSLALVVAVSGGCTLLDARENRETSQDEPILEAPTRPHRDRSRAQDQARAPQAALEETRVTAIVRAAGSVAPAVVTVNVLRTERITPRTAWESFFLPPGAARRTPGLGSGFVVDGSGIILTNEHVVRGAEQIRVTFPDGRDFQAELVGADEVTDVAVLRVEGAQLPAVSLGTSRDLHIGEWAIAIGNPFGNLISNAEPSVTAGVISAVGRHIVPSDQDRGFYLGMIQTDASVNPGNSGGPLVNALGEVVGMNASIFTRGGGSEGLSFAIPIDRAMRIARDLREHGVVRRAWTGLDAAAEEGDPWGRTRGVQVARVAEGSPAHDAGLRGGERLVLANGVRLMNPLDFEAVLLDLHAGDMLTLEVEGRGSPVTIRTAPLPTLQAERITVLQQMDLVTVTPQIRAERGLVNEQGALVIRISQEMAGTLGLREGDVILQINNVPIRAANQVAQVLDGVPPGGSIRLYFERNGGIAVRDFFIRR